MPFEVARSQEEIAARYAALVVGRGPMSWEHEPLFDRLDYAHARVFMGPGDTPTAAEYRRIMDAVPHLDTEIREYMSFAVEKAVGHRGLSAMRSVQKLRSMAWLAGRDDVVDAMDLAGYPRYGAPKLRAFAEGMGLVGMWRAKGGRVLALMADGHPCRPDCRGCAS